MLVATLGAPKELAHAENTEIRELRDEEDDYFKANYEYTEQLYDDWVLARTKLEQVNNARKRVSPLSGTGKFNGCICVSYARYKTGFTAQFGPLGKRGWAKYWPINNIIPTVGGIVVTNESAYGHVAYIEKVTADLIEVSHANYGSCGVRKTSYLLNDSRILGYWDSGK